MSGRSKYLLFPILVHFIVLNLSSCGEEEKEKEGLINIVMNAPDSFLSASPGDTATAVTWGCLVISSTTTVCLYSYNGVVQTDAIITDAARSAGPGATGFQFIQPGSTIAGATPGSLRYFIYQARFVDGVEQEGTINLEGTLDFYGNKTKDGSDPAALVWALGWGTAGAPTMDTQ